MALAYLAEAVPPPHRHTAIGAMSTAFLVAGVARAGFVLAAIGIAGGAGAGPLTARFNLCFPILCLSLAGLLLVAAGCLTVFAHLQNRQEQRA